MATTTTKPCPGCLAKVTGTPGVSLRNTSDIDPYNGSATSVRSVRSVGLFASFFMGAIGAVFAFAL